MAGQQPHAAGAGQEESRGGRGRHGGRHPPPGNTLGRTRCGRLEGRPHPAHSGRRLGGATNP
eukprot:5503342-Lingulodinium_polyedra.AAC.1